MRAMHLLVRRETVGIRGRHREDTLVGGRVDDLVILLILVGVAGRRDNERAPAHCRNRGLQVRVRVLGGLGDDDDLRTVVGGPSDRAGHARHEGLLPRLVSVSLLEAGFDTHRQDLCLGGDTNEARPL